MENVNYKNIIIQYINEFNENEPIFLEDIKEYISKYIKNNKIMVDLQKVFENVNVIINRLNNESYIKTFERGIYYKPVENIFGKMNLDKKKVIEKKYLKDENGKVNGYITGAKLFNMYNLTTQNPNVTTIITNNCKNKYDYKVEYLNIIIRKPAIKITEENYKYLQFIDLLVNKENVKIENNKYLEIIYEFKEKNNLDFEKILKYARETKNTKILKILCELAR